MLPQKVRTIMRVLLTYIRAPQELRAQKEKTLLQSEKIQLQRERILNQKEKILSQKEMLRAQKERLYPLQVLKVFYKSALGLVQTYDFAQKCADRHDQLAADIVVAHGVQNLPAAFALARECNGAVYCNVIEIPSYRDRPLSPNWTELCTDFLDATFSGYLSRCEKIVTVGHRLGKELEKYGPPVSILPNYKPAPSCTDPSETSSLRQKISLSDDDILLLAISTITTGLKSVVESLEKLPENVHLIVMGNVKPAAYQNEIVELCTALGVTQRVHIIDPVPYEQLNDTIQSADLGVIILDPKIKNHEVSLPNRVFDYIQAGTPFVCPEIYDIAKIARDHDLGTVTKDLSATSWTAAISEALTGLERLTYNIQKASGKFTWDQLEDQMLELFHGAKNVSFVGYNNLYKNQRTLRMAKTLERTGICVKIACSQLDDTPTNVEGTPIIGIHRFLMDE